MDAARVEVEQQLFWARSGLGISPPRSSYSPD